MDGQPFATATVWVRADLAAGLSPRALEERPLSEQLGVELGGATQTITAVSATKTDAESLQVPRAHPCCASSVRPRTRATAPSFAA